MNPHAHEQVTYLRATTSVDRLVKVNPTMTTTKPGRMNMVVSKRGRSSEHSRTKSQSQQLSKHKYRFPSELRQEERKAKRKHEHGHTTSTVASPQGEKSRCLGGRSRNHKGILPFRLPQIFVRRNVTRTGCQSALP